MKLIMTLNAIKFNFMNNAIKHLTLKKLRVYKNAKLDNSQKTPQEYHLLATYQTIELGGVVKLIKKVKEDDQEATCKIIIAYEEIFDTIHAYCSWP